MEKSMYNNYEIISEFLNNDYNYKELVNHLNSKYGDIIISEDMVKKILNDSNIDNNIKQLIKDHKKKLNIIDSEFSKEQLNRIYELMEKELHKMVRTKYVLDEEENIKFLRPAYLYINGFSYGQISSILGMSKSTISKYINKTLELNILNNESSAIVKCKLEENGKYNNYDLRDDIKKVVEIFFKTGGNYTLTMEEANISERTLTRYLGHEDLLDILGEPRYNMLFELINKVNRKQKMDASEKGLYVQKVEKYLNVDGPRSVRKLSEILSCILIDKITDVDVLAKKVDLGLPALKPYLLNTDNIRKIFGDFISEEYEKAKISLFEKKVDDAQQIRTIEYYLNSRCSNLTLPENLGIKPGMAKRHLNDNLSNLEYYFGPGLEDRIREHKEEVTAIRMRCPRYLYIIETPELISIVRENLFYVKPEQFKSLLLCSKYLECKGDFELFNQTVNVTRNSLISNLKREVVLDLLNDEAKEKLLLYIEAEELLTLGDRIVEKREFIKKVVSTFALNRYDVDAVMNELNIPIEVLTRIVKDDMLTTYNLENMGKKIREIVLNYVPLEETTEKAKGK